METPSFSFTYGITHNCEDQIKVTIYRAEKTTEKIIYNTNQAFFKPNRENTMELSTRLKPDDLFLPTPRTLVLIRPHLRIDSQPVLSQTHNVIWRNIHIQNGNGNVQKSFSVVKIMQGAQLCFTGQGYEKKLHGYITDGLLNSLDAVAKYVINVTIQRKKPNEEWKPVKLPEEEIEKIRRTIEERLKWKNFLKLQRIELVQNTEKIRRETSMVEHVVAAIEKNVLKLSEEEGSDIAAMKIPIVSNFLGIYFGVCRAMKGDIAGAIAEVASGALADLPGVGTAASAAIDVGLLAKDIAEAVNNERQHRRLMEHEIKYLKRRNEEIKAQIKVFAPESDIFGRGNYVSFYDESEMAYIDDISKIHIRSGDLIDAIQIEYRFGGINPYHGGYGGSLHTMVLGPNEKITTVKVSTCNEALSSLTFYTDLGRIESFGKVQNNVRSYVLIDGAYLAAIKGYDMFKNYIGQATKMCPSMPGLEVVPAIGFISKF